MHFIWGRTLKNESGSTPLNSLNGSNETLGRWIPHFWPVFQNRSDMCQIKNFTSKGIFHIIASVTDQAQNAISFAYHLINMHFSFIIWNFDCNTGISREGVRIGKGIVFRSLRVSVVWYNMSTIIILNRITNPQGSFAHVILDYRYTNWFNNNTFILILKQLLVMMTFIH